ncbi:hypothetical protein KIN20_029069 [Parelaphostrongylus tenuis]|uniref:Uncharacterized protein n=1 Tax=Parelaphostrongylus tenuis TaxID=148309 RepID=A0AAD5R217_PARTN|nr:hypothetical protein KIN20_029069 [Parelaphostrongylus tenuis]
MATTPAPLTRAQRTFIGRLPGVGKQVAGSITSHNASQSVCPVCDDLFERKKSNFRRTSGALLYMG